jgi:hypothetical protein
MYKLRDWIDEKHFDENTEEGKRNLYQLSRNPYAIDYLENHPEKINWVHFAYNTNPKTICIHAKNLDKIKWDELSANENAFYLLQKNEDKVNIDYLVYNKNQEHPFIQSFYKKNRMCSFHKIQIKITIDDNKKIFPHIWETSKEIFEMDKSKMNKFSISRNPNAVDYLKQNQDKICWTEFCKNEAIFELDYQKMKEKNKYFFEELVQKVFNPERVIRMANMFQMDFYDYLDYI